jgi:hypothetical protein
VLGASDVLANGATLGTSSLLDVSLLGMLLGNSDGIHYPNFQPTPLLVIGAPSTVGFCSVAKEPSRTIQGEKRNLVATFLFSWIRFAIAPARPFFTIDDSFIQSAELVDVP